MTPRQDPTPARDRLELRAQWTVPRRGRHLSAKDFLPPPPPPLAARLTGACGIAALVAGALALAILAAVLEALAPAWFD